MRHYAPAPTDAVLADLLGEPSLARGVVHHEVIPPRAAEFLELPGWLDSRIADGLGQDTVLQPPHSPGAGRKSGGTRPVPLPDKGTRTGSGRRVRRPCECS